MDELIPETVGFTDLPILWIFVRTYKLSIVGFETCNLLFKAGVIRLLLFVDLILTVTSEVICYMDRFLKAHGPFEMSGLSNITIFISFVDFRQKQFLSLNLLRI